MDINKYEKLSEETLESLSERFEELFENDPNVSDVDVQLGVSISWLIKRYLIMSLSFHNVLLISCISFILIEWRTDCQLFKSWNVCDQ